MMYAGLSGSVCAYASGKCRMRPFYAGRRWRATNRSVENLTSVAGADDAPEGERRAQVRDALAADAAVRLVPAVRPDDRAEQAVRQHPDVERLVGHALGLRVADQAADEALVRLAVTDDVLE